jgi:alpha-N-arabinofuranosidase
MLRHVDPSAELVVCGHDDNWNVELLQTIGRRINLVDHLSIHRYWINGGPETEFSAAEYYALLAEADDTEAFVKRTTAILQDATGGQRRIGIALDEWGVWHPEARPWGPGDVARREPITYEQAGTLRDALAAAAALEGFHRQCQVLSMANLAQIVNVLQAPVMTAGDRMWLTPTYHALRLHAPHIGAIALPIEIEHGGRLPNGASAVTATASRTADGLALTLINRHFDQGASVRVVCADAPEQATGRMLTADSPAAGNSAEHPDRVAPAHLPVASDGRGAWRVELPPHTLATVLFKSAL